MLGFELFDTELQLAGVILNRVASERHFEMLRDAITSSCKTKILGWLPKEPVIAIPERHLGLHGAGEHSGEREGMLDALASLAEKHLDLDSLLDLRCGLEFDEQPTPRIVKSQVDDTVRVGVPSDHAFSFYYEDNLDLLRERGVEIVRFSPLHDIALPSDLDGLYFGGGYPELHAKQLSGNRQMLNDVRAFAASGKPVYAECGGMLYLAESLKTADGSNYTMAGVLPLSMQMTDKLVQFGYVIVEFTEDCLLGLAGTVVRGHSFHYSRVSSQGEVATSYRVRYSMSGREEMEGFRRRNVLASYIHLHFRTNSTIAESFVAAIRQAQVARAVTA